MRRPDPVPCPNCAVGEADTCLNGRFTERGIKSRHGFAAEYFTDEEAFLVRIPPELAPLGVLVEPLSIVEKALEQIWSVQSRVRWEPRRVAVLGAGPIGLLAALALRTRDLDVMVYDRTLAGPRKTIADAIGATLIQATEGKDLSVSLPEEPDLVIEATGYSPLGLQACRVLAANGIVCLTGVPSGKRVMEVDANALNAGMVLENHAVVGTVSSNRRHFEAAIHDLGVFEHRWPETVSTMITTRLPLQRSAEGLEKGPEDVKVVVQFPD